MYIHLRWICSDPSVYLYFFAQSIMMLSSIHLAVYILKATTRPLYACMPAYVVYSAYVHKSAFFPLLICLPLYSHALVSDQLILSHKANELNCRFDLHSGRCRCGCVHYLISPFFSLICKTFVYLCIRRKFVVIQRCAP